VYVSDSGLTTGFKPSGTDAIYSIGKDKKAKALIKDKELGKPNGLYATKDAVWVVNFGTPELWALKAGKKSDVTKLPKGSLDGIVPVGDDVIISSWESASLWRGKPGGTFTEIITGVKDPADIGYDSKRGRVLVPLFSGNEVRAFELK